MTEASTSPLPEWLDVSRETLDRLNQFSDLVKKWNPAINLVSKRSLADLWDRHLMDSAQLFAMVPAEARHLADLGSGGGFPGVVIAILAAEAMPALLVTLVEADRRKATFLSEAGRILALNCQVKSERIETMDPLHADVLTARALAPLPLLCGYAHRHLTANGLALFAKGQQVDDEILAARQAWSFDLAQRPSKSEAGARILTICNIRHV